MTARPALDEQAMEVADELRYLRWLRGASLQMVAHKRRLSSDTYEVRVEDVNSVLLPLGMLKGTGLEPAPVCANCRWWGHEDSVHGWRTCPELRRVLCFDRDFTTPPTFRCNQHQFREETDDAS